LAMAIRVRDRGRARAPEKFCDIVLKAHHSGVVYPLALVSLAEVPVF